MSQRVLSFHYTLSNAAGDILDSSAMSTPLAFIEGSGHIIPGLEKELVLLKTGDKKEIRVPAAEAYGPKEKDMILTVPKSGLPVPNVKLGDKFRGGPDQHSPVFTVIEVKETEVVLDGNHPLAGQDLVFQIEMTAIREATAVELAHGHAHGGDGHHH